jgi:signal transduction histidine kinase
MDGRPGLVKITTGLTDEERITIKISDDGPGIPEEALAKLFEPFFTTKPAGKGTGLGLSVSYGIIKDHGGEILVKSEPGKGATFVIHFPSKASRVIISAC